LLEFAQKWDEKYPSIYQPRQRQWVHIILLFDYPQEIHRIIYTTTAIESLNSVIGKAIKQRKLFPNGNATMKVVYLPIQQASKKWTMPIFNWTAAINRFVIEFEGRFPLQ
jgi:transposase-like protein